MMPMKDKLIKCQQSGRNEKLTDQDKGWFEISKKKNWWVTVTGAEGVDCLPPTA